MQPTNSRPGMLSQVRTDQRRQDDAPGPVNVRSNSGSQIQQEEDDDDNKSQELRPIGQNQLTRVQPRVQQIQPRVQQAQPVIQEAQPVVQEVQPVVEQVQPVVQQAPPVIQTQPANVFQTRKMDLQADDRKVEEDKKPEKVVLKREAPPPKVEKKPSIKAEPPQPEEKEEEYIDLGFKQYKNFDILCRKEGYFNKRFGLKDSSENDSRQRYKFDEVNKTNQVPLYQKNRQAHQKEKKRQESYEEEQVDSADSWEEEEEEEVLQQDTPTQQEEVEEYIYYSISGITLHNQFTSNYSDDLSTLYIKCQDSFDQYTSSIKNGQDYNNISSLKIKIQRDVTSESDSPLYTILEFFNGSKKLIGQTLIKNPSKFEQDSFEIQKVSYTDEKMTVESTSIGEFKAQGEITKQKYNNKTQVKIDNIQFSFHQEDQELKVEKGSNIQYYLQVKDSLQKHSHSIQHFKEGLALIKFFLMFYPRESMAIVSLHQWNKETNEQILIGQGEISTRLNAHNIPVEIYSSEKHIATILLNVESPYSQCKQISIDAIQQIQFKQFSLPLKMNRKALVKKVVYLSINQSILFFSPSYKKQKLNNSKLIQDSVISGSPSSRIQNSPHGRNINSLLSEKRVVMKNNFFKDSIKQSPSELNLQNNKKLAPIILPNQAQSTKNVKLIPIQTPTNMMSKQGDFQLDGIQMSKKTSLQQLNLQKGSPRDLSSIMKAYNINSGMMKNQSSVLLKQQASAGSPVNDLNQNKPLPKKIVMRQSLDLNKNYNIINGQGDEKKGGSQLKDAQAQASIQGGRKQRQVISEIHKKKFTVQKKNINQFKDQEKYDPDKDYDIKQDFFEKSILKDSKIDNLDSLPLQIQKSVSVQGSMILPDMAKDSLKESSIQEEIKTPSKFFIDLPEDQRSKIREERNKIIQEQEKFNRSFVNFKTTDY